MCLSFKDGDERHISVTIPLWFHSRPGQILLPVKFFLVANTDISNEPAVTNEFEEGIIGNHEQLGVCFNKRKNVGDPVEHKASKEQKK